MKEKTYLSPNGTITYWISDKVNPTEPTLVFCHGVTADHRLFAKQVAFLASQYQLFNWDLPLHGKSAQYHPFSYHQTCTDLRAILAGESISRIVLIGQSAGGYIAQTFISEYPEMAAGFIGVGTTPFGQRYYKASDLFWIKHYGAIARLIPYRLYCRMSADSVTINAEARIDFIDGLRQLGQAGMLKATQGIYDEFLQHSQQEVVFPCPVLLTYGVKDQTGYVQKYNQAWAKATGYELRIIPDASHNANYDNYQLFNQWISAFMNALPKEHH